MNKFPCEELGCVTDGLEPNFTQLNEPNYTANRFPVGRRIGHCVCSIAHSLVGTQSDTHYDSIVWNCCWFFLLLTENRENCRVTEQLAGHILRHAGIVAHVGQTGLDDEQVSFAANDEIAAFFLRFNAHAISQPGDVRRWDTLRCQASQLNLSFQFHTPRVGILRKVLSDNCNLK